MRSKVSLVPYLLWSIIFIVVPLLIVLFTAFTTTDGTFTFENILKASDYSNIFIHSIVLAAIATIICLILAYPLAFIMSRKSASNQRLMMMLIMLPMWMNFLLRTYAWMTLLEKTGLINTVLKAIGLNPLNMINTQGAVVLGMVYNYLPFMILPLYSIMAKIDGSVLEAAQDLGANSWNIFTRVVFPLSKPGIITGIIMVFVPSVSTFVISRMLGGGTFLLIGDLIDMQFLGNTYNPNLGSGIAFVLMLIILVCMGFLNKIDKEEMEEMLI